MDDTPVLPISEIHSSYYLRMRVQDRPGVLADIARILSEVGISIGSMFQQTSGDKQDDILFLPPEAHEGAIDTALLRIRPRSERRWDGTECGGWSRSRV